MTALPAYKKSLPGDTGTTRHAASLRIRDHRFHILESRIGDPDWQETADYISACFYREYQARADVEMPRLIGLRDELGRLLAAVGLRDAHEGTLFLEQYLDNAIENALSEGPGQTVPRRDIIEIGHLAGSGKGMSRFLFTALTALLTDWHYPWIAFTGTREVRCVFRKLNLSPVYVRRADPARLPCGGASWGSYYDHDPVVMVGNVAGGHNTLRGHGVYRMMNLELNKEFRHAVA